MMNSGVVYQRSAPLRLAAGALGVLERMLPQRLYSMVYRASFAMYRGFIRFAYLRYWPWYVVRGDAEGRKRTLLVHRVMPHSLVGWRGLEATSEVLRRIDARGVQGNLAECGVARGGSAALIAFTARTQRTRRHLWLFDSFEGLPDPTKEDFDREGKTGTHLRPLPRGSCLGQLDDVRSLLFDKFGLDQGAITLVQGWFQNTLPASRDAIGSLALLRLDGDWYESTMCCLENLFDQVQSGGYLIIDDYVSCYGARRAVDEFLNRRKLHAMMVFDGRGGCYFPKPEAPDLPTERVTR